MKCTLEFDPTQVTTWRDDETTIKGGPSYASKIETVRIRVTSDYLPIMVTLTLKPTWLERIGRGPGQQRVFLWEPIFSEWLSQTKGCLVKVVHPEEKAMINQLLVAANLPVDHYATVEPV